MNITKDKLALIPIIEYIMLNPIVAPNLSSLNIKFVNNNCPICITIIPKLEFPNK